MRALDLVDDLLSRGQIATTTDDAAHALSIPADQVRVRFHRLVQSGRIFTPARGLWVAVPPEFRSWGVLPGLHFLDQLMTHLDRAYYVGWLSAAELHGAAHQRPQVLQVAVDRAVSDRDLGRVRLRFTARRRLVELPREQHNVPTGQVWVASPALTAFDLAADPDLGGGVSNVATVLMELAEEGRLEAGALSELAPLFSLSAVRRLGVLLDTVEQNGLTGGLHDFTERRRRFPADLLAPADPATGPVDTRWRLRMNAAVEPDL